MLKFHFTMSSHLIEEISVSTVLANTWQVLSQLLKLPLILKLSIVHLIRLWHLDVPLLSHPSSVEKRSQSILTVLKVLDD